jgi:folate-binding protein YgfZ
MSEAAFLEWRRWLTAHGGRSERMGGEVVDFGDSEAEYRAVREGAALLDRSGSQTLDVEGPDAARFLHGLTTGDVASMPLGMVLYTLVTDDRGRVLSDAVLWRREPSRYRLICERGFASPVLQWFEAHRIADRVRLGADEFPGSFFRLEGPAWREAYARAGLAPLPDDAEAGDWGAPGAERGSVLCVSGTALVFAPFDVAARTWKTLSGAGFRPVGERAAERARIERGIARAGREFEGDVLPMEVGLEGAVSYAKGCYVGQEIIARATYRGHVHRALTGVRMPGDVAPPRCAPVVAEGTTAGWITSAVAWPGRGVCALACIRRENSVPGTPVKVVDEGVERDAVLEAIPF